MNGEEPKYTALDARNAVYLHTSGVMCVCVWERRRDGKEEQEEATVGLGWSRAQTQRVVFGLAPPCIPIRVVCTRPLGVALGHTSFRPLISAQPLTPHLSARAAAPARPLKALRRY